MMIVGNRHHVGTIQKELTSLEAQHRYRRAGRLELLIWLPLLALLAGLIWLVARADNSPATPTQAPAAGLELVLSGAVNTRLALSANDLLGELCTPTGFKMTLPAEGAGYPFVLTFEGDAYLSRALPVHYELGPGVPPLTLALGASVAGGSESAAHPASFKAYTGSITVGKDYRRFSAYLTDEHGRQLYVSGYLSCSV